MDGIWRNGFLNFDSPGCKGKSQPCPLGCMNYQYQEYWCYAYNVGIDNAKHLGRKVTSTWQECADHAKDMKADGLSWNNATCDLKEGNLMLSHKKGQGQWVGLFPCP